MATRARDLLIRSRALLDRSREAASQLFGPPPTQPPPRPPVVAQSPSQAERERAAEEALAALCANVALRDLNLVDSLLSQLEEMEAREEDTDRLGELYRLDHLATRLRRNAENLRVLAGRDATDATTETTSLVDAVRGAMSSIDQYSRVTIGRVVSLGVVGFASEDLSRLLAELLDNATKSSAPNTPVRVSAHLTEQGSVLLRIEDEGIGLPPDRLAELNDRLSGEPVLDDSAVRHMGLAVVRRLSARHGMRTWLDRRVPHGTTASVLLPAGLIADLPEATWSGQQTVVFPQAPRGTAVAEAPAPARSRSGLPKRTPAAPPPKPAPQPHRPQPGSMVGGTTASGLPRRVSHSLKNPTGQAPEPAGPAPAEDRAAGHEKLLADLGAFTAGEREAREQQGADEPGEKQQ
ncbi:sensor histidine kinase [Amycolatopsis thermophila]|uniref:histidine kinase n=1 Tax=Amycolatopsis thermophila TaxID=206084 RepID=A0ABU0F0H4_9PSEU|nr:ATP-binding protein [Amycolatopsis thermophila]MDQ0380706.1 two-component sensor histidine kinase [Amycolatopsis thermophila]